MPGHLRSARIALTTCLTLAVPALAWTGPVSGIVRVETRPGVVPASPIVYAEPLDSPPPRRPVSVALRQHRKTFLPHVLGVPLGSTVAFPNDDTIFHNVFSLSGPEPFDLGLYRAGASRARTFSQPGTYRVFCNIHPQMTAIVVVVSTPYVTTTGTDGRFTLDLPPGRYRLTALSDRVEPVSVEVIAASGAVVAPELHLDETRWVLVQHKNKYGQNYPAAAYAR